jgi:CDP-diacylglycerol--glycerol-3-phosphate 3-phosphatidyltransferase
MIRLPELRKTAGYFFTQHLARLLAKTPITPNALTWSGLLLSIGAAVLIGTGHIFAAGFVVLVGGFFDMLDGALARLTNSTSQFGAILDSTLDRLSEAVILLAILVAYARGQVEPAVAGVVVAGLAWLGSLLVSYIRARAEALGIECEVGLFTRAERVVILVLGLLLSQFDSALMIALAVIAALSLITAGQRLIYVWQKTRKMT